MIDARRTLDEVGVPTLLRIGPYRFHFYAGDHAPPHVHVESAGADAVYRLEPVLRVRRSGYTPRQLREVEQLIVTNSSEFLRRWHEHFDR